MLVIFCYDKQKINECYKKAGKQAAKRLDAFQTYYVS
jgi:hypothetical protein